MGKGRHSAERNFVVGKKMTPTTDHRETDELEQSFADLRQSRIEEIKDEFRKAMKAETEQRAMIEAPPRQLTDRQRLIARVYTPNDIGQRESITPLHGNTGDAPVHKSLEIHYAWNRSKKSIPYRANPTK